MPFSAERKNLDSGIVVLAMTGTVTMGNQPQQLEWSVGVLSIFRMVSLDKVLAIDPAVDAAVASIGAA